MKFSPWMLAILVFVGGLGAIVYQAYQLNEVRLGIRDLRPQKGTVDIVPDISGKETSKKNNLSSLRLLHLMGDPESSKNDPVLDVKNAVDTNLKLELVGTIRGSLGDRDSALIQVKGKETKRYYVGDQIEGGVQLDSVNEDTVMLKRGGTLETLRYSKTEMGAGSDAASPVQNRVRVQPKQRAVSASEEATEQRSQEGSQEVDQKENAPVATDEGAVKKPLTLRERLKGKNRPLTPLHSE